MKCFYFNVKCKLCNEYESDNRSLYAFSCMKSIILSIIGLLMQYTNGINSTVQSVYVTLVSLILTVV